MKKTKTLRLLCLLLCLLAFTGTKQLNAQCWSKIASSPNSNFTVAIATNGTLWAWGRNNDGQLGDGTTTNRNTPTQIGMATNWQSIECGIQHTIAT